MGGCIGRPTFPIWEFGRSGEKVEFQHEILFALASSQRDILDFELPVLAGDLRIASCDYLSLCV